MAAMTLGFAVVIAGCSSTQNGATHSAASPRASVGSTLRVAVAPDYPPLVFEQGGAIVGAEVDLARALGKELGRPVQLVALKRDDLINAIRDGRADIIMSGMSVTQGRQLRAAFCHPYLTNQLRAIFRRGDDRFQTANDVRATTSRIGVLPGTTADLFIQNNCPDAQRIPLQSRQDVFFSLTDGGKIDLFIDDIFALAQILSQHEAALAPLSEPLSFEVIAWATPPENEALLHDVNQTLAKWRSDGTLDQTLQRWMPYMKRP
jgi:ABC-type amino acid transport substrate-binding protein